MPRQNEASKKPKKKPAKRKKKKPVKVRATDALVASRIDEVYEMILRGGRTRDVREFAAKKWLDSPPVSDRQIDRYIKAARDLLYQDHGIKRRQLRARQQTRYELLYGLSIESGDWPGALAVLREAARLQGLYPAIRNEHTGKNGKPIKHEHTGKVEMTIEQVLAEYGDVIADDLDDANDAPADGQSGNSTPDDPPK